MLIVRQPKPLRRPIRGRPPGATSGDLDPTASASSAGLKPADRLERRADRPALGAFQAPVAAMKATMSATPVSFGRSVQTKGRTPRCPVASWSITSRSSPTWGARPGGLVDDQQVRPRNRRAAFAGYLSGPLELALLPPFSIRQPGHGVCSGIITRQALMANHAVHGSSWRLPWCEGPAMRR